MDYNETAFFFQKLKLFIFLEDKVELLTKSEDTLFSPGIFPRSFGEIRKYLFFFLYVFIKRYVRIKRFFVFYLRVDEYLYGYKEKENILLLSLIDRIKKIVFYQYLVNKM